MAPAHDVKMALELLQCAKEEDFPPDYDTLTADCIMWVHAITCDRHISENEGLVPYGGTSGRISILPAWSDGWRIVPRLAGTTWPGRRRTTTGAARQPCICWRRRERVVLACATALDGGWRMPTPAECGLAAAQRGVAWRPPREGWP